MELTVRIKRLCNPENNLEIGAILSVFNQDVQQKQLIEQSLIQFAVEHLYPKEVLKFYSDIENNIPSIVVLKDVNNLKSVFEKVSIPDNFTSLNS